MEKSQFVRRSIVILWPADIKVGLILEFSFSLSVNSILLASVGSCIDFKLPSVPRHREMMDENDKREFDTSPPTTPRAACLIRM